MWSPWPRFLTHFTIGLPAMLLVTIAIPALAQTTVRWEALPNSALSSQLPSPLPPGSTSPAAIVGGWNAAALDTRRDQLLILAAGGHGDYAGNEVYAFQHSLARFTRLTDPSRAAQWKVASADVLTDGSLPSVHSYGGVGYDPDQDIALRCGGSRWWDGNPTRICWGFQPHTRIWHNLGVLMNASSGRPFFKGTTGTSWMLWDSSAHKFLAAGYQNYVYLNFTTMKSEPIACGALMTGRNAVLDPDAHVLYLVGKGETRRLDLTLPHTSTSCPSTTGTSDAKLTTTGAREIEDLNLYSSDPTVQRHRMDPAGGIGLTWDPGAGVVIAYGRTADLTAGRVYTLSPSHAQPTEGVWTAWDADPAGPLPPIPTGTGMWGKVWLHDDCLYVVTATSLPVYRTCSLPWRAGMPRPSLLPPRSSLTVTPATAHIGTESLTTVGNRPSGEAVTSPSLPPCSPGAGTFCPPTMTWSWVMHPLKPAEVGPVTNSNHGGVITANSGPKHMRMAYDPTSGRVLLTGGDREGIADGNGQSSVWATADGQTWTMLSPPCISDPAQIAPARPDNVVWAIDGKRNRAVIMPGFYFGITKAQTDCPGPTYMHTALLFNLATNRWEPVPWPAPHPTWKLPNQYGSDGNSTWGVIDPVADALYTYFWDGSWGANLEKLDLATNTWTTRQLGAKTATQPYDSAMRNTFGNRAQPALDAQGRALYLVNLTGRLYRVRLDVPDHRGEWVSQVPAGCLPPADTSQESYLVFDSDHRAVLRICTPNLAGEVLGVAAYFVDQRTWIWYPAPMDQPYPVQGNVFAYSPKCKCVISIGGHAVKSRVTGRRLGNPIVNWTFRLN